MITSKNMYYGVVMAILAITSFLLFFYAYTIVLHIDESGFWFNYTNKSFPYRFIPNHQLPLHTLTIYLAKVSIWLLGKTGIGLKLPQILFGIFSTGIFYFFVKKITGSIRVAALAACLLSLNPFFAHYSHEFRAYPALFFFSICSYFCLLYLLESGNSFFHWAFLLLSFLLYYLSNLSAPMFFFVLLSTVWVLKFLEMFSPLRKKFLAFKNIAFSSLFVFSLIATILFIWILLYIERPHLPELMNTYRVSHGSQINYMAIPDFFSTFLGYKYLDDWTAEFYSYPFYIWVLSLASFFHGWYRFLKNNNPLALVFASFIVLTTLFYVFSGNWIPLRSSVYLLPFILMFQAYGMDSLCQKILCHFSITDRKKGTIYAALSGILICYFLFISIGKYKNTIANLGNPFEKARDFLEKDSKPNDLIISSIYDTVTAFYFGDLIKRKNSNIYFNNKLEGIYFLTTDIAESYITVKNVFSKYEKFIDLKKFKIVADFNTQEFRKSKIVARSFSRVIIYKAIPFDNEFFGSNENALPTSNYSTPEGENCTKKIEKKGIRLNCNSKIVCTKPLITFQSIKEDDYQLIIFNHRNDKGTQHISFAALNKPVQKKDDATYHYDIFREAFSLNPLLVDNIEDSDIFAQNVSVIDLRIQQLKKGENLLLCMYGDLFRYNSLLKGVKVFNFNL